MVETLSLIRYVTKIVFENFSRISLTIVKRTARFHGGVEGGGWGIPD